jgi:hypothetical protein
LLWKILTFSANPTEDKEDKKLDYSPCWTKVTKKSKQGLICQFWAGLIYTGKTSAAIAEGTNHSFEKFGCPSKKISGCCGNSGAGTSKSYANLLNALGI